MGKSKNEGEKFLTYEQAEMEELKKIILLHAQSMKKEFAPALDLLSDEAVLKHSNKFLLERKAEYLLDQAAIKEGYESASHKHFTIEKERLEKEAEERAKQEAILKAQKDEEDRLFAEEVAMQKRLQEQRDKEDADRAAELKAKLKAQAMGTAEAQVASV